MTPYYERDNVTIYLGDCREIMPTLEPHSVDMILADPPYGETSLVWDRMVSDWTTAADAMLAAHGSLWCFGSLRYFMASRVTFGEWNHAQEIVWEKHNGSIFHADRFRRVHELAVHFYPARTPWGEVYKSPQFTMDATKKTTRRKGRPAHSGNIDATVFVSHDGGPRHMRSVLRVRSCNGYAKHPTQKPIGILTPLIEYSCPPGGLVLDPFMGSGSTLEAARLLGRRAIGIEIEEKYAEIAAIRLQQTVLPLEVA